MKNVEPQTKLQPGTPLPENASGEKPFNEQQFSTDLTAAREAAIKAVTNMRDEGTCNFDCATIRFPRLRTTTVEAVGGLRKAHDGSYHIDNPVPAQAHQRTIQAKTISEFLRSLGYNTSVFYMMD